MDQNTKDQQAATLGRTALSEPSPTTPPSAATVAGSSALYAAGQVQAAYPEPQPPTPAGSVPVPTGLQTEALGDIPLHFSLKDMTGPGAVVPMASSGSGGLLRILQKVAMVAKPAFWPAQLAAVLILCVLIGGSVIGYNLTHTVHQPVPTPKPTTPAIVTTPTTPQAPTAPTPTPVVTTPTPTPKPAPTPTPAPTPAPKPTLPPVAGKDTSYSLGVLVIKYFPLTANGQNIDINVTGDVGDSYTSIRQHTIDVTNNLLADLPKATSYLGYAYNNAPSLTYHVVATIEHTSAVPINSTLHAGFPTYPDYPGIMSSHDICNYVDNQGVHEVWLWAYQGPSKPGTSYPYLGIAESKMSGPYGDISNSYRWNDMPVCKHTYVVYSFNYGRGTAEAMHSWGHQNEAELGEVDGNLFGPWFAPDSGPDPGLFQGPMAAQTLGVNARCGSVHDPPNARQGYDYANPTPQMSDCLDWNPDGMGKLSPISCTLWGCSDISDSNNAQLNYLIWYWQNLPGRNNTKTYQGHQLRNWWDVHGNFDSVMASSRHLTL